MPRKRQPVTFDVIWHACIQCGACVAVCPQSEPFVSPFDTIAVATPCAIACMRCVEVCPTSAVLRQAQHEPLRQAQHESLRQAGQAAG